jgi:hypothetical protein
VIKNISSSILTFSITYFPGAYVSLKFWNSPIHNCIWCMMKKSIYKNTKIHSYFFKRSDSILSCYVSSIKGWKKWWFQKQISSKNVITSKLRKFSPSYVYSVLQYYIHATFIRSFIGHSYIHSYWYLLLLVIIEDGKDGSYCSIGI